MPLKGETMERRAFAVAFGRLALAHHTELDDPTMEVYWESLRDIPIQALVATLAHLTIHAAGYFPKTGEIRRAVDEHNDKIQRMLPTGWPTGPCCADCDDTTWRDVRGMVERCPCWHTNEVYRASRAFAPQRYFQP